MSTCISNANQTSTINMSRDYIMKHVGGPKMPLKKRIEVINKTQNENGKDKILSNTQKQISTRPTISCIHSQKTTLRSRHLKAIGMKDITRQVMHSTRK